MFFFFSFDVEKLRKRGIINTCRVLKSVEGILLDYKMSSLNELFKQLEVHSANEEHKEVFDTSYEILKSSPHDARAFKWTIVSSINLDQYLTALKIFKNYPQADSGDLLLEKLYVYYKLNLNQELSRQFEELGDKVNDDRGLLHLKAQFLYRIGEYEAALDYYKELIDATIDEEDPEALDLSVNERAILADGYQVGVFNRFNSKLPLTPDREDSYDLIFNEALIHLGLKNYSKSLELLDLAEEKSNEANSDYEDQLNEGFPIKLQKAYIHQITGNTEKAEHILKSIDASKLTDSLNKLILENNLVSSSLNVNDPLLTLKELDYPNILTKLSPRFSVLQNTKLFKNYAKLSAQVGKKVSGNQFPNDFAANALSSLAKAGVLLDQDDPKTKARKSFKYALTSKSLPASLASAQLNVNVGNLDSAATVLENLESKDKTLPGVSSALLSIYDQLGSNKKKLLLFNEIYDLYSAKTEFANIDEYDFLKILALKFYNIECEKSKDLLIKLSTYQSDDLISIVLSQDSSDSSKLKPVEEITSGLDVEDLITQGAERLSRQQVISSKTNKVVKKRVKKNKKLPKSFDENKLPDPERWLPLKDRSTYRPKKGKKKLSKDTQGGVADNTTEESFNAAVNSKTKQNKPAQKKSKKKGGK